MSGVGLPAWTLENLLRILAGRFRISDVQGYQATLAFAGLCAAFPAQLESGAAGEAIAPWAFSNGLDVTQKTAFLAELGHGESGESQVKNEKGKKRKSCHPAIRLGERDLTAKSAGTLIYSMLMPYRTLGQGQGFSQNKGANGAIGSTYTKPRCWPWMLHPWPCSHSE